MTTTLQQRFGALPGPAPDAGLELVVGSLADYKALGEHHYRAERPATATRVLAFHHAGRSAVGRFLGRPAEPTPVAVLVESLPSLSCKMRNWALHDRYGSWLCPRQRAALLNQEVRVISRVVVHPSWRGLGLAVRLVREALKKPTTIYTEALAAMGRVNPFFEHAGMIPYHRPPHPFDTRLTDAMRSVDLSPDDLASLDLTHQKIESLKPLQRGWFLKELYRWYRQNGGRSAAHSTDPKHHLRVARQRLMLEPVYYLHSNDADTDTQANPQS
jgi:GNAT superfamily N-acetyltransferase